MDDWGINRGGGVTYIEELKEVIQRLHGVKATHVESVYVKEIFPIHH
jgi:hypothetical protein